MAPLRVHPADSSVTMPLLDRLNDDLKTAMRARDDVRLRTIRSLRSALQQAEIARRQGGTATLDEAEALAVVQKQAKQRREAIEQFRAAGRDDLVAKEQEELTVLESYLPAALGDDEIRSVLRGLAAEVGASTPADIGRLMAPAMQRLRGQADGRRVQELAREVLSA